METNFLCGWDFENEQADYKELRDYQEFCGEPFLVEWSSVRDRIYQEAKLYNKWTIKSSLCDYTVAQTKTNGCVSYGVSAGVEDSLDMAKQKGKRSELLRSCAPWLYGGYHNLIKGRPGSGGCCWTGDTKVWTTEGIKTMEELNGKTFFVLSFDKDKSRPVLRKARCWFNGMKECCKITTNIGTFTSSKDHHFMLRSGACVQAQFLPSVRYDATGHGEKRVKLLSGRVGIDTAGYPHIKETANGCSRVKGKKYGQIRLNTLLKEDILGEFSDREVHHRDGNKVNNSLDNIELLTKSEHANIHYGGKIDKAGFKRIIRGKSVPEKNQSEREVAVVEYEPLLSYPVYSIEVESDEPDDKRPFTQHNYLVIPHENQNAHACHGIFVCNSMSGMMKFIAQYGILPYDLLPKIYADGEVDWNKNPKSWKQVFEKYGNEAAQFKIRVAKLPRNFDDIVACLKAGYAIPYGTNKKLVLDKKTGWYRLSGSTAHCMCWSGFGGKDGRQQTAAEGKEEDSHIIKIRGAMVGEKSGSKM